MGIRRTLAAGLVTIGMVIGSTTPAAAITATASCSDRGRNLNASASYIRKGAYNEWSMARWTLNGPGLGTKNNISIRLFANGTQKWGYNSSDSIPKGNGHTGMNKLRTLASHNEKISFTAIFDIFGPDPRCTAERSGL